MDQIVTVLVEDLPEADLAQEGLHTILGIEVRETLETTMGLMLEAPGQTPDQVVLDNLIITKDLLVQAGQVARVIIDHQVVHLHQEADARQVEVLAHAEVVGDNNG